MPKQKKKMKSFKDFKKGKEDIKSDQETGSLEPDEQQMLSVSHN